MGSDDARRCPPPVFQPPLPARPTGRWLRWRTQAWLLGCAIALAACTSLPGGGPSNPDNRQEEQARTMYQTGRYQEAGQIWTRLAQSPDSPQADYYYLRASDAMVLAKQWEQAQLASQQVNPDKLRRQQQFLLALVQAELALAKDHLDHAENLLRLDGDRLSNDLFARQQRLQQELSYRRETPEARSLLQLSELRSAEDIRGASEPVAFMRELDPLSNRRLLEMAAQPETGGNLRGWLTLTAAMRQALFPTDGNPVRQWLRENPTHAVDRRMAESLLDEYRRSFRAPARVAVFLPTSGRYQGPANAIRDGLMSAYLASEQAQGSWLRFYSVDGNDGVLDAYFRAHDDGADFIIGPLTKENVQALMEVPGLDTPVLALNQVQDMSLVELSLADLIFSFPLSPEAEAAQAAEHALSFEHFSAAVLIPDNLWGKRMSDAFQKAYVDGGGIVVTEMRYASRQSDHSAILRQLLNAGPIDMIFLAATPQQGRLIKPQLKFLDADHIPVYATPQIFSGTPDNRADRDLERVAIPVAPIVLNPTEPGGVRLASRRNGAMDSFYALGMDAWAILPYLGLMARNPDLQYSGQSGTLSVQGNGQVQRHLSWVLFQNGRLGTFEEWPKVEIFTGSDGSTDEDRGID